MAKYGNFKTADLPTTPKFGIGKNPNQSRQGDVLIEKRPSTDPPNGYRPMATNKDVLAEGEVTGHHHRVKLPAGVTLELLRAPGSSTDDLSNKWLRTSPTPGYSGGGVGVVHQEHSTAPLEVGAAYDAIRQTVVDPSTAARTVVKD